MNIIPEDSGVRIDTDGKIWLNFDYYVIPDGMKYLVIYAPNLGRDGHEEPIGKHWNIHGAIALAELFDANLMSLANVVRQYFVAVSRNMEAPGEPICIDAYGDALDTFWEIVGGCEADGMSILEEARHGHNHQVNLAGNGDRVSVMMVAAFTAEQEV